MQTYFSLLYHACVAECHFCTLLREEPCGLLERKGKAEGESREGEHRKGEQEECAQARAPRAMDRRPQSTRAAQQTCAPHGKAGACRAVLVPAPRAPFRLGLTLLTFSS